MHAIAMKINVSTEILVKSFQLLIFVTINPVFSDKGISKTTAFLNSDKNHHFSLGRGR